MKDNQLDITTISAKNKAFIESAINLYSAPNLVETVKTVSKIDLKYLDIDLINLRDQIVNSISKIRLMKNEQVLSILNNALQSNNYIMVRDKIKQKIGFSNIKVPQILVPKLIEYFNVIETIKYLNTMPGTDGKPVNCIKLPEMQ